MQIGGGNAADGGSRQAVRSGRQLSAWRASSRDWWRGTDCTRRCGCVGSQVDFDGDTVTALAGQNTMVHNMQVGMSAVVRLDLAMDGLHWSKYDYASRSLASIVCPPTRPDRCCALLDFHSWTAHNSPFDRDRLHPIDSCPASLIEFS